MPVRAKAAAIVISAKTPAEKEGLLKLINEAKCPIHYVNFCKKTTGETRHMMFCMPGRAEIIDSGQPTPYSRMLNDIQTNTLTVWDVNKFGAGATRRINLGDIYSMVIDDTEYTVDY